MKLSSDEILNLELLVNRFAGPNAVIVQNMVQTIKELNKDPPPALVKCPECGVHLDESV